MSAGDSLGQSDGFVKRFLHCRSSGGIVWLARERRTIWGSLAGVAAAVGVTGLVGSDASSAAAGADIGFSAATGLVSDGEGSSATVAG